MNNENQIKAGLWSTTSKAGKEYFSGKVEIEGKTYRIAMFHNDNKLSDKSPEYNLSFSEQTQQATQQPVQTSSQEFNITNPNVEVLSDDDLPW